MNKRVSVFGISGYVGAELCRLIQAHPKLTLHATASRGAQGKPLSTLWPHFTGFLDQPCHGMETPEQIQALVDDTDVAIFALPHGASVGTIAPLFAKGTPKAQIIDMSGDFRLPSHHHDLYSKHYKQTHDKPALMDHFVYGLTEWNLGRLSEAQAVANPGCFATALGLMLAPLAHAGCLPPQVTVFAATGSTGSGKTPKEGTHHPSRAANYKVYKVLGHQHVPEVLAQLEALGGTTRLSFVPASAPMTHGIFATAHLHTNKPKQLAWHITDAYKNAPFVRVREGSPQLNHVVGSNFADLGLFCGDEELVIACAIDNTLKGAASQAIQNLNVMLGLPQTTGLLHAPSLP